LSRAVEWGERGEGDREISESDAAGFERDDLVVATGDVGAEDNPVLEFVRFAGSFLLLPCFTLFLFPKVEVATADSLPFSRPRFFANSPESTLPTSGPYKSAPSPSLLSSCLMDFRILDGE
jgi:hypothetical protein